MPTEETAPGQPADDQPEYVYATVYRPPDFDQTMSGERQGACVTQAGKLAEKLRGGEYADKFTVAVTLYVVDVRGAEADVRALPAELDGFVRDEEVTRQKVKKKKKKRP